MIDKSETELLKDDKNGKYFIYYPCLLQPQEWTSPGFLLGWFL